jgi:hypothetical protein
MINSRFVRIIAQPEVGQINGVLGSVWLRWCRRSRSPMPPASSRGPPPRAVTAGVRVADAIGDETLCEASHPPVRHMAFHHQRPAVRLFLPRRNSLYRKAFNCKMLLGPKPVLGPADTR